MNFMPKALKTARGYSRLVAQPGIQMGAYSGLKQAHVDCGHQSSDWGHCTQGYGLRIFFFERQTLDFGMHYHALALICT